MKIIYKINCTYILLVLNKKSIWFTFTANLYTRVSQTTVQSHNIIIRYVASQNAVKTNRIHQITLKYSYFFWNNT